MRKLLTRTQAPIPPHTIAIAGIGASATIAMLAVLSDPLGLPLLAAGFGSSCVLLFTFPESPLSQPMNVIGGHVVSTICGLIVAAVLPVTWWSMALAVGLAIIAMAMLRITHPPAGGNPLTVMITGAGWSYLFAPILIGAIMIVVLGLIYRRTSKLDSRRISPSRRRALRG